MYANQAQAAQQVQGIGEQFTQTVFDVETVLQHQYFRIRFGRLNDGRRETGVAGGFRPYQQPVALGHVFGSRIGLHRIQRQRAMHRAVHLQTTLGHRRKFAAQQKVHIETGTRQHHTVEPTNCAGTDNPYDRFIKARFILCRHHGNSSAIRPSACPSAAFSASAVRRVCNAPKNSPSRTTNSAGK